MSGKITNGAKFAVVNDDNGTLSPHLTGKYFRALADNAAAKKPWLGPQGFDGETLPEAEEPGWMQKSMNKLAAIRNNFSGGGAGAGDWAEVKEYYAKAFVKPFVGVPRETDTSYYPATGELMPDYQSSYESYEQYEKLSREAWDGGDIQKYNLNERRAALLAASKALKKSEVDDKELEKKIDDALEGLVAVKIVG